jgi:hypothetical protein
MIAGGIYPFIRQTMARSLPIKQENYSLKFKQIILLTLGMIIWFGCLYEFDKWQKQNLIKNQGINCQI